MKLRWLERIAKRILQGLLKRVKSAMTEQTIKALNEGLSEARDTAITKGDPMGIFMVELLATLASMHLPPETSVTQARKRQRSRANGKTF